MTESHTRWSATSPSFLIAAAVAAFMLFLGVRGLLALRLPHTASALRWSTPAMPSGFGSRATAI